MQALSSPQEAHRFPMSEHLVLKCCSGSLSAHLRADNLQEVQRWRHLKMSMLLGCHSGILSAHMCGLHVSQKFQAMVLALHI